MAQRLTIIAAIVGSIPTWRKVKEKRLSTRFPLFILAVYGIMSEAKKIR